MIPVENFYYEFACDIHGFVMHEIQFYEYDPIEHKVYFFAMCLECPEPEIQLLWLPAEEWNEITPLECEPKTN